MCSFIFKLIFSSLLKFKIKKIYFKKYIFWRQLEIVMEQRQLRQRKNFRMFEKF